MDGRNKVQPSGRQNTHKILLKNIQNEHVVVRKAR